jgi:hypothetical protein
MVRPRLLLAALTLASSVFAAPKGPPPDYGRPPEPTTPGDVALWVPRIVLFPVYLVTEYVIRAPLGWAIGGAERTGLPQTLYDFFTFGADRRAGVFPTAIFDFGFRPSVGVYGFWNDAFMRGHDLSLHASTGGSDWLTLAYSERFSFGPEYKNSVAFEASAKRRPDRTYFGLGPDTRQSALLRYGADWLQARAFFEQRPSKATLLQTETMIGSTDFRPGGYGDDARLSDAVEAGMPPPPGYPRGYTLVRSEATLSYDQRRLEPLPGAGIFGAAVASHNADLRSRGTFVGYGGRVGGFLDVNGYRRVVSLDVAARFTDPIGHSEIPFTELVTLGGDEPMRGFYHGRLTDHSAAVLALTYRWPVWVWLDGTLRNEVGNVFGEHLSGFTPKKLRWSGTIGIESTNIAETTFQFFFGLGSETFESGAKVDSVRLVFGATSGL